MHCKTLLRTLENVHRIIPGMHLFKETIDNNKSSRDFQFPFNKEIRSSIIINTLAISVLKNHKNRSIDETSTFTLTPI